MGPMSNLSDWGLYTHRPGTAGCSTEAIRELYEARDRGSGRNSWRIPGTDAVSLIRTEPEPSTGHFSSNGGSERTYKPEGVETHKGKTGEGAARLSDVL